MRLPLLVKRMRVLSSLRWLVRSLRMRLRFLRSVVSPLRLMNGLLWVRLRLMRLFPISRRSSWKLLP